MSTRAECVMLNKGPHIGEAIRFLTDVSRRMGRHARKTFATHRRLNVAATEWLEVERSGSESQLRCFLSASYFHHTLYEQNALKKTARARSRHPGEQAINRQGAQPYHAPTLSACAEM
jgi:hypothetical protein